MALQEKQAAQKQIILLQKKMVHILWYKNRISFSDKKYGTYFGYKTIYSIYIFYQKLVHIYVKKIGHNFVKQKMVHIYDTKTRIPFFRNKIWHTFLVKK